MTKRDRLMLLTVLAVALLGGFWMFVLSPQRKAATEAEGRVVTAQSALDTAREQVNAGRRAQQAFRRDRTTIVKLGRVVPETDDIPTLLTQLQSLANKEKVKFTSYAIDSSNAGPTTSTSSTTVTPSSSTGDQVGSGSTAAVAPLFPPGSVAIEGGLGRTPIALELRGTYFQLERYLRSVQRFAVLSQKSSRTNGRLMIVDGFSYKAADAADDVDTPSLTTPSDTASAQEDDTKDKVRRAFSLQPKLTATLSASIYFAPPLDAPAAKSAGTGSTATPAGSTSAPTGSTTGTAAIGGVQ